MIWFILIIIKFSFYFELLSHQNTINIMNKIVFSFNSCHFMRNNFINDRKLQYLKEW